MCGMVASFGRKRRARGAYNVCALTCDKNTEAMSVRKTYLSAFLTFRLRCPEVLLIQINY